MDILEVLIKAFSWNSAFNGDISKWDTSQVTNMYAMFWQASSFNRPMGVGTHLK